VHFYFFDFGGFAVRSLCSCWLRVLFLYVILSFVFYTLVGQERVFFVVILVVIPFAVYTLVGQELNFSIVDCFVWMKS